MANKLHHYENDGTKNSNKDAINDRDINSETEELTTVFFS